MKTAAALTRRQVSRYRFRNRTLRFKPNTFRNIRAVLVENGNSSAVATVRVSAIAKATVIQRVAELMVTMLTGSFVHSLVTQRLS